MARFLRLCSEGEAAGVTMRTFRRDQQVTVPHGTDPVRTIEVPVKELRGFFVTADRSDDEIVLTYRQLGAEELKRTYSYDAQTGAPIPLPDSTDHVFVGPEDQ